MANDIVFFRRKLLFLPAIEKEKEPESKKIGEKGVFLDSTVLSLPQRAAY